MIRYETHLPLMNNDKPFKEHRAERESGDNFIVNWHQSLELLYLLYGDVEVITNDVGVRLAAGDLAVVNSSYIHDIICHKKSSYYCIIINIDFLSGFGIKIDEIEFDRLVRSDSVKRHVLEIMELCREKRAGYELLSKAAILTLVSELFIKYSKRREELDNRDGKGKLDVAKDIIKYLQQSYAEKLTLEAISDAVGYNKYYVSHIFKSVVGVTVMTYLNMLRVFHAKELLKTKKYTVSEACRMCGFDNLSYFTRTYKKHMDRLPSADFEKEAEPKKQTDASYDCSGCPGCY